MLEFHCHKEVTKCIEQIDIENFLPSVTFHCGRCRAEFVTPIGLHLHRTKHHPATGKLELLKSSFLSHISAF